MVENMFSIYRAPIQNVTPMKNIDIIEFVNILKSEKYRKECDECKRLKKEGTQDELRSYKSKYLDYITIAGTFSKRGIENLKELSGYYVADIDNIKNIEETKENLKKDPHTLVLFTSPSGGLKCIIKIPKGLEVFDGYVVGYYNYIKKSYKIDGKIDSKTKDPARACFCSYDSEVYVNFNAEIWEGFFKEEIIIKKNFPSYSEATLKSMLKFIPCRNWGEHTFAIMLALIHYGTYKEKDYFGVFRWWINNFDKSISVEEMKEKWDLQKNKTVKNPVTIRSLIKEAKDHGFKFPEKIQNIGKPKDYNHLDAAKNIISNFDDFLQLANKFYKIQPFFYDKAKMWWLWNFKETKWEYVDEIDIMNEIDEAVRKPYTTQSKIKGEILESMKRVGRKKHPKETPIKWIQFKDKAFSLTSGELYDVTPDYFFTNPIPWSLGETSETPIMDKLFEEWVGKEYVQDLYEIIAYACYRAYPIQNLVCLFGSGRNGKTQYMKVLHNFLGIGNICSTELDLIAGNNSSRFEIFKLYKKLLCLLGETNFGKMNNTSIIKKLTGGDLIGFEKKGKDSFDDYSYAKIVIASNSLPISNDTSDGFSRRWHIIDFPNEFKEGKDIIATIPEEEYKALALKITEILPLLLEKGSYANQGTIIERKHKYMMASNPLPIFLKEFTIEDPAGYVSYNELYTKYTQYLLKNKKRRVKSTEFKATLEEEGLWVERTSRKIENEFVNGFWIIGISFKRIM